MKPILLAAMCLFLSSCGDEKEAPLRAKKTQIKTGDYGYSSCHILEFEGRRFLVNSQGGIVEL